MVIPLIAQPVEGAGTAVPWTQVNEGALPGQPGDARPLAQPEDPLRILPAPPDSTPQPTTLENAFPVSLGTFSTTLIGSLPARTRNIQNAARALDGTVLEPGDVLSFNRVVGPRTPEAGYLTAPVILREARQLQLGGGICQVASTLLVASLLSGLSVVERHRHSSPVDYIPLAQDATISWGVKDLKVRNDLDQRVRLRIEVVGSTLSARFEGEAPTGETFELETEERELPEVTAGGFRGREIELYRVRRADGEETGRELVLRDVYPAGRPRGVAP